MPKNGKRKPKFRPEPTVLTLEQLVAKITPENLHREVDWGKDVECERLLAFEIVRQPKK